MTALFLGLLILSRRFFFHGHAKIIIRRAGPLVVKGNLTYGGNELEEK
jgi:hypothetical protein